MEQTQEETRKIQFTGKSSYIVSLPKKWVEDIGLKPGEQVVIIRQGNSPLQIAPAKKQLAKTAKEATIEISRNDERSKPIRKLIALYLLGFNVINVRAKDGRLTTDQRDAVKDTVRKVLMGTEITGDSTDGMTIKVLINIVELSVEAAFKRMLLIAKSMLKDVMLALHESNLDLAKEVIRSDDEVDRFSFYIIRQLKIAIQNEHMLKDMGFENARSCLGYRVIVKNIERVGDHAVGIAKDLLEFKKPIRKSVMEEIREMSNFYLSVLDEACLSLFKNDFTQAEIAIQKTAEITKYEKKVLERSEE